tara:strand:+ start:466 stop:939 length:474 start_codon:yes stop_codon:yes gene_type:complete
MCKKNLPENAHGSTKYCGRRCALDAKNSRVTPEQREKNRLYMKEYNSRPEVKKRQLEHSRTPEAKERMRKYNSRPEIIKRKKEYNFRYNRLPHVRERKRNYGRRPDQKEASKKRHQKREKRLEKLAELELLSMLIDMNASDETMREFGFEKVNDDEM